MEISRGVLRGVRGIALRRRVWYRALDGAERGIVDLTISLVESVKSLTLVKALAVILAKLREALKSGFTRHVEEYGCGKLMEMVRIAVGFGNGEALRWRSVQFARLLALNDYNNPAGWKHDR